MDVLIGTSGWQYRDWRGRFYPAGVPTRAWLDYYSARFATVEINNSFYRLPDRSTFEAWRQTVPADFVVAVKASRYLSHVRRLRDSREPVERLMSRLEGLGDRLGPVLLQLPPNLKAAPEDLERTLGWFPPSVQVALEARHPSWYEGRTATVVRSLLERHRAAWVLADGGPLTDGGRTARAKGHPVPPAPPDWVTADWTYVRFHRGTGRPEFCYTPAALHRWAERLAGLGETGRGGRGSGRPAIAYCFFNNDPNGCAPRDARRFAGSVAKLGLRPSRVPGARETPVAAPAQ